MEDPRLETDREPFGARLGVNGSRHMRPAEQDATRRQVVVFPHDGGCYLALQHQPEVRRIGRCREDRVRCLPPVVQRPRHLHPDKRHQKAGGGHLIGGIGAGKRFR